MRLSDDQRHRVAGRARTLQERLDVPADGPPSVEDPAAWIDEWRKWVADGDPETFEARLDREGLSEAECRRRLASHGWPEEKPLPAWVDLIDDLVAFVADRDPPAVDAGCEDVPFVEVLSVVVDYARDRLGTGPPMVEETAAAGFEDWLYERLRKLFAHPLFIEFKTYVAHRDGELAFADDPEMPDEPRRYYDAFVADLLADELDDFFVEYAFLARLLATLLDQWVDAVEEFCERLAADRDALAATFGPADGLGGVVDASPFERLRGESGASTTPTGANNSSTS